jgi:16S rRNA (cytosine967-C5)-methyltransferase
MEMVYGVLRHRAFLDHVLTRFLDRPEALPAKTVQNLRLAAYQMLFMRVPDWAAVNEAVSIERTLHGLVNAVMRNMARGRAAIEAEVASLTDQAVRGELDATGMSTLASYPQWLVERWIARFGPAGAWRLMDAGNQVPRLTLRVNRMAATRQEVLAALARLGYDATPTALSPVGVRLKDQVRYQDLGSLAGRVMAQDEGAQLVSLALGPEPGMSVLDACAAPGGKALHLAEIMGNRGEVVAVESDGRRAERLNANVRVLGGPSPIVETVVADAAVYARQHAGRFDCALLDAPCTSLGTIRRNPDVKLRHGEAALVGYGRKQRALLDAVAEAVRPGGRLVYCSCSTEPEEGEHVVAGFLREHGQWSIIKPEHPGLAGDLIQPEGGMRTYPHLHETDGFFFALMTRAAR